MVVVRADRACRRCEVPAKALYRSDCFCIRFYARAFDGVDVGIELVLNAIYSKTPLG